MTGDGDVADGESGVPFGVEGQALPRLLRRFGRPQLPVFLLGGVSGAVSIALELLPSYLLGLAIDAFFTRSRPFDLPLVPAAWLPGTVRAQFLLTVGLVGGLYLAAAVLSWANSWAWNYFAQHVQHDARTAAYGAMQRLELAFFDARQTGELMSVLNNDVNQLEDFLTTSLNNAVRIAVRIGVIGVIMVWLNWQLAIVALLVVPLLAVASHGFVQRIQPRYGDVRETVGRLNARLENNLGGIETVKAGTNEPFEAERVEDASRSYLEAQWAAITTRVKFFPTLRVITAAGYVATFLLGGWWVLFGPPLVFTMDLTAGVLVTFLLYSRRFRYPMRRFGEILNDYQYAEAASQRVLGLLEYDGGVPDPDDPVRLDGVEGRVEYESVSFDYGSDRGAEPGGGVTVVGDGGESAATDGGESAATDGGESAATDGGESARTDSTGPDGLPTIRDVSFEVEPGEFVGVVGPTGAGKTTLLKLLLRFYDVDAGAIRLDGVDVSDLALAGLRGAVGYVSQEPYLFHGTVRENIAYGRPDVDGAAIREAARLAGAHAFVTDLADGYDTVVGERGVRLSGGQRQRVAIARAILSDPDVLVLDEATSHVDNETEALIQENLADLVADRTTFAVAHRLSTVRDADRILVVDDGEVVERGTHEDLLARDGLYAALWAVQVGEVEGLPREFRERVEGRAPTD